MKRIFLMTAALCALNALCAGQTASSLFLKGQEQTQEIFSTESKMYSKVGHHGPAVENHMMALRIYFNDSGAIDVYSKSGKGMELLKYLWYPTDEQMLGEGAGCDEYYVGKTVGLGGIGLWDGQKVLKLAMTKGRRALVGKTEHGHFAEVISYGVPYKDSMVDISIRVDVVDGSRDAVVTASCTSGQKVQFVTGVNVNERAVTATGKGWISVWGTHPVNVSQNPIPIGGGMRFDPKLFPEMELTDGMFRLISVPSEEVKTKIVSASTKETALPDSRSFTKYVKKMKICKE